MCAMQISDGDAGSPVTATVQENDEGDDNGNEDGDYNVNTGYDNADDDEERRPAGRSRRDGMGQTGGEAGVLVSVLVSVLLIRQTAHTGSGLTP